MSSTGSMNGVSMEDRKSKDWRREEQRTIATKYNAIRAIQATGGMNDGVVICRTHKQPESSEMRRAGFVCLHVLKERQAISVLEDTNDFKFNRLRPQAVEVPRRQSVKMLLRHFAPMR